MVPGEFRQVIPCFRASPERGRTCASNPGSSAIFSPVGTIDSDYRGEVGVILANLGQEPFVIRRGERIAQLVIARHEQAALVEVEALDETARGAGGFGSTGR